MDRDRSPASPLRDPSYSVPYKHPQLLASLHKGRRSLPTAGWEWPCWARGGEGRSRWQWGQVQPDAKWVHHRRKGAREDAEKCMPCWSVLHKTCVVRRWCVRCNGWDCARGGHLTTSLGMISPFLTWTKLVSSLIIELGCGENSGWRRRPWWPGWVFTLCFGLFWHGYMAHVRPLHEPIRAPFTPKAPPVHFYYVANWYWMLKTRFGGVSCFWPLFGTHLLDFF